jgi:quercetin dioxygenase-like cupin family protein
LARAGDELLNPATGQRILFRKTGADTGGELLEVETWYRAGARPAPGHYHPSQDEHFEVLSGVVRARVDGEKQELIEGDLLDVTRGTVHEFGGHPDRDAHVLWQIRPALRTEDFFEATFPLGVPSPLEFAPIALAYRNEFRLARPAWPLQLPALAAIAAFARLRG